MAKLYLKFEDSILKEYDLNSGSTITIGRLPDNGIYIDNLAVSGHHARILWEGSQFVLEDNNSLNGTFVNNRRISRTPLRHGDNVLVGKHIIAFWDEGAQSAVGAVATEPVPAAPAMSGLDSTVVLDTRKAKEMIAQAADGGHVVAAVPAKERIGLLHVMSGKTDQPQYVLSGKLTLIGKSDMATIKLKGWFAPKVAGVINKRDGKYFVAPSEPKIKVNVNGTKIPGPTELGDGDLIEVGGVKLTFSFAE
jgi:predicted component of type VI protein secretion system